MKKQDLERMLNDERANNNQLGSQLENSAAVIAAHQQCCHDVAVAYKQLETRLQQIAASMNKTGD